MPEIEVKKAIATEESPVAVSKQLSNLSVDYVTEDMIDDEVDNLTRMVNRARRASIAKKAVKNSSSVRELRPSLVSMPDIGVKSTAATSADVNASSSGESIKIKAGHSILPIEEPTGSMADNADNVASVVDRGVDKGVDKTTVTSDSRQQQKRAVRRASSRKQAYFDTALSRIVIVEPVLDKGDDKPTSATEKYSRQQGKVGSEDKDNNGGDGSGAPPPSMSKRRSSARMAILQKGLSSRRLVVDDVGLVVDKGVDKGVDKSTVERDSRQQQKKLDQRTKITYFDPVSSRILLVDSIVENGIVNAV